MMFGKLKYIALGIIIGVTVIAAPSIASEIKEYMLYKADYKIIVNGQQYNNDELPILNYKGVTYTPLKAIGSLLNSDVQWNAEVGQVEIVKNVDIEKVAEVETNTPSSTPKPQSTIKIISNKNDPFEICEIDGNKYISIRTLRELCGEFWWKLREADDMTKYFTLHRSHQDSKENINPIYTLTNLLDVGISMYVQVEEYEQKIKPLITKTSQ